MRRGVWRRRRAAIAWGGVLAVALALLTASPAAAHNLPYALADVQFPQPDQVRIEVRCHLAALIMGVPQTGLSPDATRRFLALSDDDLRQREASAVRRFLSGLSLRADGRLLDDVQAAFPSPAALRADAEASQFSPRPSPPLTLSAALPGGTQSVDLALPPDLGAAAVFPVRRETHLDLSRAETGPGSDPRNAPETGVQCGL